MNSFEGTFPPEGWILLSENKENTWRQLSKVEYIHPNYGLQSMQAESSEHFIFVGISENEENRWEKNYKINYHYFDADIFSTRSEESGSYLVKMAKSKEYFNELLISPELTMSEELYNKDNWWEISLYFHYFVTSQNPDYDINVAICYDCEDIEKAEWEILFSKWDLSYDYKVWNSSFLPSEIADYSSSFRISILFEGRTSQGFGLDDIKIFSYKDSPPLWQGPVIPSGCAGIDHHPCCGSDSDDAGPDVALGMLLMGAFVMILRRRKGN